mmetsp:Transcript_9807/g.29497  ORF Transcript_9807/g.29497 Transcript_9807/m.29497 type:complete len:376 (+) Transcript_9807:140-1267(+)|eukprot:CAMPEP_0206150576 /NCGR_PEP_ID=MMETSP1473-20131121/38366_1 /ASSEMBLY_ACC=CAM_ASM_001109 /TAXON_ID=1461547 /ORGANISM="Stichococcus sp, Strain RCC1054" /LENGTH=375 /DNA_ID=CAMNT_0053548083 /DNA_START=123 /DNA_END=1250 /DNA_ORIENTATION=-
MKVSTCAVALVALVAAAGCAAPTAAQAITDVDILNFALNLEYLEAEFYSWAVFGKGLDADLRGEGGRTSIGGQKANLTGNVLQYATEIANDEIAHVRFLRTALGAAAVSQPRLNIGSTFVTAVRAAFGMPNLRPNFSPYANDLFFMHGAFVFEDVGVTAYKGAAALISNPDYLTAAAGILAVEAYHAGTVRSYLAENANVTVEAYGVTVQTIVDAIAALRTNLSGLSAENPNDFGVIGEDGAYNVVPTDENGIVYSRTPQQVVSIVTFGSTTGRGGFFPNGLNGNINASLAAGEAVAVGDSTPEGMLAGPAASSPDAEDSPAGSPDAAMTPGEEDTAGAPADSTAAPTSGASTAGLSVAALAAASLVGAASLLLA